VRVSENCVSGAQKTLFVRFPVRILYRHITKQLYWAFTKRRTRHGEYRIAEPEKALLDWVYLRRREGLSVVVLDEVSWSPIDKEKLLGYATRYPKSVRESPLPVLWQLNTGAAQFVELDRSGTSRKNAKEREVARQYREAESFQASKTGWITAAKRSAHSPGYLLKWRQNCHLLRSNVEKTGIYASGHYLESDDARFSYVTRAAFLAKS
jgi:hypothetical protein